MKPILTSTLFPQRDSLVSKWLSIEYRFWVKDGDVSPLPLSGLGPTQRRQVQYLGTSSPWDIKDAISYVATIFI